MTNVRRVFVWALLVSCAGCGDDGTSGASAGSPDTSSGAAAGSGGSSSSSSSSGGGAMGASGAEPASGASNGFSWAFAAAAVGFDCNESSAALLAKKVTHVTVGGSTVFVGMQQISANDQDPVVARFDPSGAKVFCEHSKKGGGIDGRAYGVTWDGKDSLYVVYTIVGGGTLFDAAAKGGWLSSYGDGGGSSKVTVVGALDAATGVVKRATFVPSRLVKNGQTKTNTLTPADAVHVLADGSLELLGNAAYCTLNPDRSSMCDPAKSDDYPKAYRARFTADLSTMTCASATGVSVVKQPCP